MGTSGLERIARATAAAEADYSCNSVDFDTDVSAKDKDPRFPVPVTCKKRNCDHVVVFSRHFNSEDWEEAMLALRPDPGSAGICQFCNEEIKRKRLKTVIDSK